MNTGVKISTGYMSLIKRFPLRPIKNEEMLDMASDLYGELALKAASRTADEEDYLEILGKLIHEYESQHLLPLAKPMTPQRALESLMEDNNITQLELAHRTGSSQSVISEFLSGKRGLSKNLIMRLADYFKVSPELFLIAHQKGS